LRVEGSGFRIQNYASDNRVYLASSPPFPLVTSGVVHTACVGRAGLSSEALACCRTTLDLSRTLRASPGPTPSPVTDPHAASDARSFAGNVTSVAADTSDCLPIVYPCTTASDSTTVVARTRCHRCCRSAMAVHPRQMTAVVEPAHPVSMSIPVSISVSASMPTSVRVSGRKARSSSREIFAFSFSYFVTGTERPRGDVNPTVPLRTGGEQFDGL